MPLLCFRVLLLFVVAAGTCTAKEAGGNWPQFRGVHSAGLNAEARPPVKIGPMEGVIWQIAVPPSPSSPSVWGERIFLTTFHQGSLETRCYATEDGRLLWSRGIRPDKIEDHHPVQGSPAAATPATDGQRVVSYFGSFGLICHDLDGKELWRHPLPLAQSASGFGSGASPIIVGKRVLLNRDQAENSFLLALDLETGKKLWAAERPDAAGSFGSPALWRNNGVDEVVLGGSARLKGYDLQTGAERWVVTGVAGMVCTTPVVADGMLFFGAWSPGQADAPRQPWEDFLKKYDADGDGAVLLADYPEAKRADMRWRDRNRDGKITQEDWALLRAGDARAENVLLALKPGGTGDISASHVRWKFQRGLPYVSCPLYYEGRIYLVRDGGIISSIDAKTGEPFYVQERLNANGNYFSSPVAADGRIYIASLAGKLTVLKAGGEKPEILHQADFRSRIAATPVLVGQRLYLRTAETLWAFGK